jgi:hypothetical protein
VQSSLRIYKAIEIQTFAPEVTVTFNNYALGVATFDVVFTQNVFNFVALNVDGTAFSGAPIVTIIPIDGANYTVQVEGMDQNGTVEVQVPAGAAQNGVGLDNLESNLVIWDYNLTAPTVVVTDDYDPTDLNRPVTNQIYCYIRYASLWIWCRSCRCCNSWYSQRYNVLVTHQLILV